MGKQGSMTPAIRTTNWVSELISSMSGPLRNAKSSRMHGSHERRTPLSGILFCYVN